jgi:hypothetical protein
LIRPEAADEHHAEAVLRRSVCPRKTATKIARQRFPAP